MIDNLVGVNEVIKLDVNFPFAYTRDIDSCIAIIFHRFNSALLLHLEAYEEVNLDILEEIINLKDDMLVDVEIYLGPHTSSNARKMVEDFLTSKDIPYTIKAAYTNIYNKGSVGYDIVNNTYYKVSGFDEIEEVGSKNL